MSLVPRSTKGASPMRKLLMPAAVATVMAVVGTVAGAPVALAADACPNAAIRAQQDAQGLPDCRAWEQVSPVEKGNSTVNIGFPVQSALAAGSLAYMSTNAPPGASASVGVGFYRAKRTDGGWVPGFYDLPQENPARLLVLGTRWISPDGTRSVGVSRLPLAPGATPGHLGVYVHDVDTAKRTLIAEEPAEDPFGNGSLADEFSAPAYGSSPVAGRDRRPQARGVQERRRPWFWCSGGPGAVVGIGGRRAAAGQSDARRHARAKRGERVGSRCPAVSTPDQRRWVARLLHDS